MDLDWLWILLAIVIVGVFLWVFLWKEKPYDLSIFLALYHLLSVVSMLFLDVFDSFDYEAQLLARPPRKVYTSFPSAPQGDILGPIQSLEQVKRGISSCLLL